ncbi:hypothetical protein N7478_001399 [Penicillium angulare]|uniref:uncharacterized protein n=1 Tax=Penicillium angulare TaxID=116970 RepID=UPI00254058E6|nr:uncharacterized protein N7478_001399 [Penicillium angulare]KAJ5292148.1 hypothetical protein N7478_001399 [Penicillium angulare]
MSEFEREGLVSVPSDQKLRSEAQWRVWIGHIRSAANSEGVWDYIDPEKPDDEILEIPAARSEPEVPRDNRGRPKELEDLSEDEIRLWDLKVRIYERSESKRTKLLKTMTRLNSLITRLLATEHRYLIVDEDSPREKLLKLAEMFCPKPESRQQELRRAWRAMIRSPNQSVNIDQWITQWDSLFEEGKVAKIPDCSLGDAFAIRDFLDAIQNIDDTFCIGWKRELSKRTDDLKFHEVTADYRRRRTDLSTIPQRSASNIAYTTIKDLPEEILDENACRTHCPCGSGNHHYRQCFYINRELRPEGWIPREGVARRIPEFTKKMNTKDQEAIEELLEKGDSAHIVAAEPFTSMIVF